MTRSTEPVETGRKCPPSCILDEYEPSRSGSPKVDMYCRGCRLTVSVLAHQVCPKSQALRPVSRSDNP